MKWSLAPCRYLATCLALSALVSGSNEANAAPVSFGNNAYELIIVSDPLLGTNNAWSTASAAAAAMTFNGVSGHLATVTSAEENSFLASLVGTYSGWAGAWLGGSAGAGGTGWLVGPEAGSAFSYTNWGGIEPNNMGYLYMTISPATVLENFFAVGVWADDSEVGGPQGFPSGGTDPVIGYFVEYEGAAVVPLPASLPLLLGGLGGLGLIGRRRRGQAAA